MTVRWYVDPIGGDNGNTGTAPTDAFADLSTAVTAANADASASQEIAIMGDLSMSSAVTVTASNLIITGYDDNGVTAFSDYQTLTAFDYAQRPTITMSLSFSDGILISNGNTVLCFGLLFEGSGTTRYALSSTGSTGCWAIDCEFANFFAGAAATQRASSFYRTVFRDSAVGAFITASSALFWSCEFRDLTGYAIGKTSGTESGDVRNCLFTNTGGANAYPLEYATTSSGWSISDSIFFDNPTDYALPGSTYTSNNAYTSDGGTYHTLGNFSGTADADDYEFDPAFVDAASDDYHIPLTSSVVGISAAPTSPAFNLDRNASTDVLGPYGPPVASSPVIIPRGTHQFLVKMSSGYFIEQNATPEQWSLSATGDDRVPWVATVTLGGSAALGGSAGTVYSQATITTDRPLYEAATYTLTHALPIYGGITFAGGNTFSGLRPSLTGGAESSSAPLLLDLYAPWVREDGVAGGFFEISAAGDYVLTGGIETVKKAVWSWLLTQLRELHYAPAFGSIVRLKTLRPADLDTYAEQLADGITSGIPWVDSASVTMQFTDNHLRIGVRVRAFGEIINDTAKVQV